MASAAELRGVSVVGAGAFNPAIFQPRWLADKELVPENVAEHGEKDCVITPQLTAYTADWLSVQITNNQAVFATVQEARQVDLRDFARGVFEVLPETPIDALGINSDAHFAVGSEAEWHALGDQWLPKDFWEPLFANGEWRTRDDGQAVGLRSLTVEATRDEPSGFVRLEVAPSVRIKPHGVYVGVNSHYQLSLEGRRGSGHDAAHVIANEWDGARGLDEALLGGVLEAT